MGPELALWAVGDEEILSACRPVVIGSADVLRIVAGRIGSEMPEVPCVASENDLPETGASILDLSNIDAGGVVPGKVSPECGRAAYEYIERAIDMAMRGTVHAMTTAPINKESLNLAGIHEPGHTEILGRLTKAKSFAMLQYSKKITVSFVTTHVPLTRASEMLSVQRIFEVGKLTAEFMSRVFDRPPTLGVCALNPHAGEGGLFGSEESEIIVPAIEQLKKEGINAEGPLVPDAAFVEEGRKRYDAFIAMYHDQGHIPFKMLSFFEGVNVTLGLPIIRTSVDHGTAFDIAWQGKADPGSMHAALLLASKLGKNT